MATHILEIWPDNFKAILSGKRRFEIRRIDRNFKVRDYLFLREANPKTMIYTGRQVSAYVTDIFTFAPWCGNEFGILAGCCIMSIRVEAGVFFRNEKIAGRSVYDFDNKGRLRK